MNKLAAAILYWGFLALVLGFCPAGAAAGEAPAAHYPPPLASYQDAAADSIGRVLAGRLRQEPFNAVATAMFFLAIVHTFLAPKLTHLSRCFEERHQAALAARAAAGQPAREEVSFVAKMLHLLGEIELVFGLWVVPLLIALAVAKGGDAARNYLSHGLNFTEPAFVVVIMTIAASRPVLHLAERLMALLAGLGGGSAPAWWLAILTVGPLLGSFITEPAAMTICAMLLADKLYRRRPRPAFAYATLGLLFVNVSVGGTLTHFAAPPVLMVAAKWNWGLAHMFRHFGIEAALGIIVSNLLYFFWFRKDFQSLAPATQNRAPKPAPTPFWISAAHVLFLAWTVVNNHYPALFIGGFLFYLAFVQATEHHQGELSLRPALLVGLFLAGLVVHGGLQGWWIAPVLSRLSEGPLFLSAIVLTSFNDNAMITYLASFVPDLTEAMKHAVVAGAVAGGGLTIIANAPNPAGQSLLARFFPEGVSAPRLFAGALLPTIIVAAVFFFLR